MRSEEHQAATAEASPAPAVSTTILAFDFGTKHIGAAVGDTETRLAHALAPLAPASGAARLALVEPLVREWRPARLVVGLPLSLDGAEQEMTARARRFGRQLAARFGLPVEFCDERLTSAAAIEGLRVAGRGGRRYKGLVHGEAARILLQSYLDESA